MIMPCMNSTSAFDRGGSVPFVDGGSVLLGLPGAPGCTTTGVAGSVCCAYAGEEKKPAHALAVSRMPHSRAGPLAGRAGTRDTALKFICAFSPMPFDSL